MLTLDIFKKNITVKPQCLDYSDHLWHLFDACDASTPSFNEDFAWHECFGLIYPELPWWTMVDTTLKLDIAGVFRGGGAAFMGWKTDDRWHDMGLLKFCQSTSTRGRSNINTLSYRYPIIGLKRSLLYDGNPHTWNGGFYIVTGPRSFSFLLIGRHHHFNNYKIVHHCTYAYYCEQHKL